MRKAALVALAVVSLSSCKSFRQVGSVKTIDRTDSTYYTTRKQPITIPGAELNFSTNIASGVRIVDNKPCFEIKPQIHQIYSRDKVLRAQIVIDSLGNLVMHAETEARELMIEVEEKTRLIRERTTQVIELEKKHSKLKELLLNIAYATAIAIAWFSLLFLLLNSIRPKIL
jgi:hypothetical protein